MSAEQGALDRVVTVPNALSLLRLLGVPLFLWLALGPKADGWAFTVLAVGSFTDWLDGKLARLLNQTSRLGQLLDPAADRLYIVATVLALGVRQIMPWWLVGLLLGRDLVLLGFVPVLKRLGYGPALPVHYLGKAATLNLLYALPLLLLGHGGNALEHAARIAGWAFVIWGVALYWYAAALYALQVRQLSRADAGGDSWHHELRAANSRPQDAPT
ncbi:MAG: CDP-alcohol phosphatidyltransferase family protein [Acidothermaceae bacterium]